MVNPEDRHGALGDVPVRVEAEAAEQAVSDSGPEELLDDRGARSVGAGDRVEQHVGRLRRVHGIGIDLDARLRAAEVPDEAGAGRRQTLRHHSRQADVHPQGRSAGLLHEDRQWRQPVGPEQVDRRAELFA